MPAGGRSNPPFERAGVRICRRLREEQNRRVAQRVDIHRYFRERKARHLVFRSRMEHLATLDSAREEAIQQLLSNFTDNVNVQDEKNQMLIICVSQLLAYRRKYQYIAREREIFMRKRDRLELGLYRTLDAPSHILIRALAAAERLSTPQNRNEMHRNGISSISSQLHQAATALRLVDYRRMRLISMIRTWDYEIVRRVRFWTKIEAKIQPVLERMAEALEAKQMTVPAALQPHEPLDSLPEESPNEEEYRTRRSSGSPIMWQAADPDLLSRRSSAWARLLN